MTDHRIEISRDEVVALVKQGKTWPEVAAAVGCSVRTIKRRAREWGLSERATEQLEKAAQVAGRTSAAKWTIRRAEEADRAGQVASRTLLRINQILDEVGVGETSVRSLDVVRLARTYESLVKNAQLLSGGATERHESLGEDMEVNDEPADHEPERAVSTD